MRGGTCPECGVVFSASGLHVHMRRAHSDEARPRAQHRYVHSERDETVIVDRRAVSTYVLVCSCGWRSRAVTREQYDSAERSWHQHALSALVQQQRDALGRFVGAAS